MIQVELGEWIDEIRETKKNMTTHKATVSAIAVMDLANELIQLKAIDTLWLQKHHSQVFDLLGAHQSSVSQGLEEQRLDEQLLIALWQQAQLNSKISNIGLLIGQKVNVNAKGVLANWISQCADFSEAFATFTQHISLLNPSESWAIKECTDHIEISFQFTQTKGYPFEAIERSLTAFIAWSESLTNKKLEIIRVDFAFSKPAHSELYENLFGNKIQYDAVGNCFYLNKSVLNYPLISSNHYLKKIMSERAQQVLDKLQVKDSIALNVEKLLEEDLVTYCQQEKVCDVLHMSRATLYRKLQLENTSFSELLEAARTYCNNALKRKGLSVSEISTQLGYQDVSTYYKKFKNR